MAKRRKYTHPKAKALMFATAAPGGCREWMEHVYFQGNGAFALDGCRIAYFVDGCPVVGEQPVDAETREPVLLEGKIHPHPATWDKPLKGKEYEIKFSVDGDAFRQLMTTVNYGIKHHGQFLYWKNKEDLSFAYGSTPVGLSWDGAKGLSLCLPTAPPHMNAATTWDGWRQSLHWMQFDFHTVPRSFFLWVNLKFLTDAVNSAGKSSMITFHLDKKNPQTEAFKVFGNLKDSPFNVIMPHRGP